MFYRLWSECQIINASLRAKHLPRSGIDSRPMRSQRNISNTNTGNINTIIFISSQILNSETFLSSFRYCRVRTESWAGTSFYVYCKSYSRVPIVLLKIILINPKSVIYDGKFSIQTCIGNLYFLGFSPPIDEKCCPNIGLITRWIRPYSKTVHGNKFFYSICLSSVNFSIFRLVASEY